MTALDRVGISILCGIVLLPLAVFVALRTGQKWKILATDISDRFWGPAPGTETTSGMLFSVFVGPLLEELHHSLPLVIVAWIFGPIHPVTIGSLVVSALAFGLTHSPVSDRRLITAWRTMLDKLAELLAVCFKGSLSIFIPMTTGGLGLFLGPIILLCSYLRPSEWVAAKGRMEKIRATLTFTGPGLIRGLMALFYFGLLPAEVLGSGTTVLSVGPIQHLLVPNPLTVLFVLGWSLLPAVLAHSVNNGEARFGRWCWRWFGWLRCLGRLIRRVS